MYTVIIKTPINSTTQELPSDGGSLWTYLQDCTEIMFGTDTGRVQRRSIQPDGSIKLDCLVSQTVRSDHPVAQKLLDGLFDNIPVTVTVQQI